jgi:hypothetical protein
MFVALVLVTWGVWSAMADRGAAADIQKLADLVAKNDDAALAKQAEALARKYKNLSEFMSLLKPRSEKGGGLGVGKKPGAIEPDSIEAKTAALAKKAPSSAELDGQEGDLVRMAQVMIAIAEVAKHKCEVNKKVGYLDPMDWQRWLQGMQKSSQDLAEAIKAKDPGKVKAAAAALSANCTNCHRIFRE